ncbi:hypothetical protein B0J11DRAFT_538151 [Dendryphion nanum]|uniref:Uncharacterized protein n=1 Tax=Dendryphion nanum TaxID=256645 RepID=A0A9P9DDP3_9PLEO|nr:hypothetical protein B0J11DRAFT_538151 [Dendryphion nanum]
MKPALHQTRSFATLHHALIPTFLCPALLRGAVGHATHPLQFRYSSSPSPRPIVQSTPPRRTFSSNRVCRQHAGQAAQHGSNIDSPAVNPPDTPTVAQSLPRACPGCGAPTQVFDKKEAGYYDIDRRRVKSYLEYDPQDIEQSKQENDVYTRALKQADPKLLEGLGLDHETLDTSNKVDQTAPTTPMCDRCHNLIHHNIGNPIHHPSVEAIHETIGESPHRRNHVYHIIDAADFPLSLVPNLQSSLRLPKLRTQNRRAKHKGWVSNNRIAEVSFVITRADLLVPMKQQVDGLLPYVTQVLRDALGRDNRTARLGNIYLVSAKRGWWTTKVKEDIWDRGGAGWMVGKVNVGKSNLFEVVFPKGRGSDYEDIRKIRSAAEREAMLNNAQTMEEIAKVQGQLDEEDARIERRRSQIMEPSTNAEDFPEEDEEELDLDSLLPPRQTYTPYPVLPLSSSLPGTTASPIRIPFGRNRGELIDLPGLARTSPELSTFVNSENRDDLIMTHRVTPERHVLRPGKSLVLGGGLIRITPVNEDLVFLIHPFVPLAPHITSTEKAIGLQDQTRGSGVPSIMAPNIGDKIKSAGRFKLQWDVTKKLAGPLTSSVAGKMKTDNLPFRIWSTDILIEGVGWVEVSAQVRRPQGWTPVGMAKKDPNHARAQKLKKQEEIRHKRQANYEAKVATENGGDAFDRAGIRGGGDGRVMEKKVEEVVQEEVYPEIEVFSPLGKYIGARMPMCGSILGGPKQVSSRERKARPRRSMVSVKSQRKPQVKGSE